MAENQRIVELLELYKLERAAAGTDKKKLAKADQRNAQALKNEGVSEKVIGKFQDFVTAIAGKELEGIDALIEMSKGRLTKVQDLQKEQAQMLMRTMAMPEQAKAGIASFGMTVATICRFFGADDFAQQIENKSKEIMSTIEIKLNSDQITNGDAELTDMMKRVSNKLTKSDAPTKMFDAAREDHGPLPTAADALTYGAPASGTEPRANTPVSWTTYADAFRKQGVNNEDIQKIMPAWMRASSLSSTGSKAQLDNSAEAKSFISSKEVSSMPVDTQEKVKAVTRQLTPMGSETVAAK